MILIIKNFPDELHQKLKIRAAQEKIPLYKLIIELIKKTSNELTEKEG